MTQLERVLPLLSVMLVILGGGAALASAPDTSPHPRWRPAGDEIVSAAVVRPVDVAAIGAGMRGLLTSPRPRARPKRIPGGMAVSISAVVTPTPGIRKAVRGSVCGLPGVNGTALSRIASKVKGCGIESPVRITAVEGVPLSTPATMDCATASALSAWVRGAVLPTIGKQGGGVAGLQVAGAYSCRPRNNVKGARLSEHGKGKAIDIAGIVLKNGKVLSVLKGWQDKSQGPVLKALHKAACGPFGTVLGPSANSAHRDHFHLDTAAYRSGHYCH